MPKLTIGMAHFDDYDGVYFSIQAMRLYHAEVMPDTELIVVDNSPHTPAGKAVKGLVESWAGRGNAGARYIAMPDNTGTSQPRNRIFQEATGNAVLCMDCHVMLVPNSLARLLDYYDREPNCHDLFSGPMLYDDLDSLATHFADEWRAEMWGTWACDDRGKDLDAPPLEISAMGLGMFTCRREVWLGFNEHFRGFGGEEFYIHEKFRQAGRRCLCLPFLRWLHRFGRPAGVKYPLTRWNKLRNYVIGHQELGLCLDRLHNQFVE